MREREEFNEMLDRLVLAGNGGTSWPNDNAKQFQVRFLVNIINAMADEDLERVIALRNYMHGEESA